MEEPTLSAVYALYATPESAQRAVDALRAAGVLDAEITVMSSQPLDDQAFSRRHQATNMYWIAGSGGGVGLVFGAWLTSWTEKSWPLVTGGMPIVTWWPNLVVTFEVTMLFGILATFVTLLVTAGLPRPRPRCTTNRLPTG
jgi:ActD protein